MEQHTNTKSQKTLRYLQCVQLIILKLTYIIGNMHGIVPKKTTILSTISRENLIYHIAMN